MNGARTAIRGIKRMVHYRRREPLGVVLLYHRVADLETDPQLLAVSPRNFADHLRILNRDYLPVALTDLLSQTPTPPPRPDHVVLTFDDGYADNLHQALPLLKNASVPATFFVVAGQVDQQEEFWWDEVERILLTTDNLPESLSIEVASEVFHWSLRAASEEGDPNWNVLSDQPCSPRQTAYRELCNLLRPLSPGTRDSAMVRIRNWADVSGSGRPENRALTNHELTTLARDGLVEVGSHTMTHPVLAAQPASEQKQEIEGSKRRLEQLLGTPVLSFSYPFGGHADYDRGTLGQVQEAGYSSACSNFPGAVHQGTPRYEIPRFLVRNWTGDEFARRLKTFFDD